MADTTVRVTLKYDDDDITVVDREILEMTVPASDPVKDELDGMVGVWFELRGADGHVLYRQTMHDPFHRSVEVGAPADDDSAPASIARVPVDRVEGYLVLLAPASPDGDHLAVVRASAAGPNGTTREVAELARIDVSDIVKGGRS